MVYHRQPPYSDEDIFFPSRTLARYERYLVKTLVLIDSNYERRSLCQELEISAPALEQQA
jgi:hypothetical protein